MPKKRKITDKQRREYKKIDMYWGTKMLCVICEKCSCETCHPNGPCIPQKKIMKGLKKTAKIISHHDDPPCYARLDEYGDCPKCKLHPNMQSTRLWSYCPSCDCPLENLNCPKCKQVFKSPFT